MAAERESLETRVAKIEGAMPFLGTREDIGELRGEISELRSELHDEIGKLRSEMHSEFGTVRSEIAELRGEMRAEVRSIRWTMTWAISLLGVGMGVLMFVLR